MYERVGRSAYLGTCDVLAVIARIHDIEKSKFAKKKFVTRPLENCSTLRGRRTVRLTTVIGSN